MLWDFSNLENHDKWSVSRKEIVGNKENRTGRKLHYQKKIHGLEKSYQNFLFDAGSNKESFNVLVTIDRGNISNYFLSNHAVGIREVAGSLQP